MSSAPSAGALEQGELSSSSCPIPLSPGTPEAQLLHLCFWCPSPPVVRAGRLVRWTEPARGKRCVHKASFFSIPQHTPRTEISHPLWPLVLDGTGPHKEPHSGLRPEVQVTEVGHQTPAPQSAQPAPANAFDLVCSPTWVKSAQLLPVDLCWEKTHPISFGTQRTAQPS